MPCSRMPKWNVRPPRRPGSTESAWAFSLLESGAPGTFSAPLMVVVVDGARSAEPPTNSGITPARAWMHAPELWRVACALAPVKSGSASSQPSGSRPESTRSNSATRPGSAARVHGVPGGVRGRSALALVEVRGDLVRHVEVLVGIPAVGLLGQADLFLAQRRAVRLGRVLRVRRADRDVRAHDDQRRPRRLGVGRVERGAQVVRRPAVVQPLDVEAVGLVAQSDVLAEREARSSPRS